MILILAETHDAWATEIYRELLRRACPVMRLDTRGILQTLRLDFGLSPSLHRTSVQPDEAYPSAGPSADITAVLVRTRISGMQVPNGSFHPDDQAYVSQEYSAALHAWLHALPCPVINRPVPGAQSHSAIAALALGQCQREVGFQPVYTAVLSRRESALWWFNHWQQRVRVQEIGLGRPAAYLTGPVGRERLSSLIEAGPITMQPVPIGHRYHASVVGDMVLGGVWRSAVRDGRFDGPVLDCVEFDHDLAECCRVFAQRQHLNVADIELVVDGHGVTHCLAVNEWPVFDQCSDLMRERIVHLAAGLLDLGKDSYSRDCDVRADRRSYRREPHVSSCSPLC